MTTDLDSELDALFASKKGTTHVKSTAVKVASAGTKLDGRRPPAKGVKDARDNGHTEPKKAKGSKQKNGAGVRAGSDVAAAEPSAPLKRLIDVHPPGSTPLTDAAAVALVQEYGYKGVRPPPFVKNERGPDKWPKKHEPGSFNHGDSVWYGDERYYVVCPPKDWTDTSFVMISSLHVRPGNQIDRHAVTMSVHADALEKAPVTRTLLHSQPTKQAVMTAEKKKELGITDIGDTIGEMLRGKSLEESYPICAKYIGVPEDVLRAKYAHLNHGQQRMNLGNRMRGYWKKANNGH